MNVKYGEENYYKLELIRDLPAGESISFYRQNEYAELCSGPHISNTCHVKAVKLLNVAGAYWRGDEQGRMLTRIYGVSFPSQALLEEHLHMLEEAKARDHRKLGKQLGLFMLSEVSIAFSSAHVTMMDKTAAALRARLSTEPLDTSRPMHRCAWLTT